MLLVTELGCPSACSKDLHWWHPNDSSHVVCMKRNYNLGSEQDWIELVRDVSAKMMQSENVYVVKQKWFMEICSLTNCNHQSSAGQLVSCVMHVTWVLHRNTASKACPSVSALWSWHLLASWAGTSLVPWKLEAWLLTGVHETLKKFPCCSLPNEFAVPIQCCTAVISGGKNGNCVQQLLTSWATSYILETPHLHQCFWNQISQIFFFIGNLQNCLCLLGIAFQATGNLRKGIPLFS